jgi:uncharacterized membrane protein YhaH (DUF805 family)
MIESVKHCLAHVTSLNGRDARQTFWYYVLFLFGLQMVIGVLIAIPMYVMMFSQMFDAIAQGADPESMSVRMIEGLSDQLRFQLIASAILTVLSTLIFVAAFVRRLHDAGFSGWIAAIPVVTQLFSVIYLFTTMDAVLDIMGEAMNPANQHNAFALQAEAAPYSAIGYIGYLVVIGFGVLKSQDGPNRYGEAPVRF